jgi:hypothetical protein
LFSLAFPCLPLPCLPSRPNEVIGWERMLRYATEIGQGIACLHNGEKQILHRDLKSLNVLVSIFLLFFIKQTNAFPLRCWLIFFSVYV